MDLAEYGCTGCVLGGADRNGGALSDVEAANSPTNHALTSACLGYRLVPSNRGPIFAETVPFLGESAWNDYLTIGEELGKQSEPAEDSIGCRTILYASRFS